MTLEEFEKTNATLRKQVCRARAALIRVDSPDAFVKEALDALYHIFRLSDSIDDYVKSERDNKETSDIEGRMW